MLRAVLALAVVAVLGMLAVRTLGTRGVAGLPTASGAAAGTPRQVVDEAARAVNQAVQQGAAATAERASDAGN